jgi:hypothetical protein
VLTKELHLKFPNIKPAFHSNLALPKETSNFRVVVDVGGWITLRWVL